MTVRLLLTDYQLAVAERLLETTGSANFDQLGGGGRRRHTAASSRRALAATTAASAPDDEPPLGRAP